MENDKICPYCGGLIIYSIKKYNTCSVKVYLCLHCGHIDIDAVEYIVSIPKFLNLQLFKG